MKGTWQTTSGGGGAAVGTALVILGAAYLLAKAPAALHAGGAFLGNLVRLAVITAASLATLAATATAAVVLYRRRPPRQVTPAYRARATMLPSSHLPMPAPPPAKALPAARQDVHLHFHGMTPDQVAEAIRQAQAPQ